MSLFRADLASLITTTRKLSLFVSLPRFMFLSIWHYKPRKFSHPPVQFVQKRLKGETNIFILVLAQRETRPPDNEISQLRDWQLAEKILLSTLCWCRNPSRGVLLMYIFVLLTRRFRAGEIFLLINDIYHCIVFTILFCPTTFYFPLCW